MELLRRDLEKWWICRGDEHFGKPIGRAVFRPTNIHQTKCSLPKKDPLKHLSNEIVDDAISPIWILLDEIKHTRPKINLALHQKRRARFVFNHRLSWNNIAIVVSSKHPRKETEILTFRVKRWHIHSPVVVKKSNRVIPNIILSILVVIRLAPKTSNKKELHNISILANKAKDVNLLLTKYGK